MGNAGALHKAQPSIEVIDDDANLSEIYDSSPQLH